jgi:hypothetical protein
MLRLAETSVRRMRKTHVPAPDATDRMASFKHFDPEALLSKNV